MVKEFNCERCGFITNYKRTLYLHITHEKLCESKLSSISRKILIEKYNNLSIKTDMKYKCKYCPKTLNTLCGIKFHEKKCTQNNILNTDNSIKNKNIDNSTNNTVIIKTDDSILLTLTKKIDELIIKTDKLELQLSHQNNLFFNYNFDIVTNNIKLKDYGCEDIGHIDKKMLLYYLLHKNIPELIKDIHFSKDKIENCNIRLHKNNVNYDFVEIYNQGEWRANDKTTLINDLINKSTNLLIEYESKNSKYIKSECDNDDNILGYSYDSIKTWLSTICDNDQNIYHKDITVLFINRTPLIFGNVDEEILLKSYELELEKFEKDI